MTSWFGGNTADTTRSRQTKYINARTNMISGLQKFGVNEVLRIINRIADSSRQQGTAVILRGDDPTTLFSMLSAFQNYDTIFSSDEMDETEFRSIIDYIITTLQGQNYVVRNDGNEIFVAWPQPTDPEPAQGDDDKTIAQ